jgi:hypothetical protein
MYKEVAFMKRIVFMVTVALVVALILVGGAASAQKPAAVSVQVGPTAQAIDGGQTLLVTVEVACEPGLQVLEANVSATQGATTNLVGFGGVDCDGNPAVHTVSVAAPDGQLFSRGKASVSAFVLLLDPQTGTVQGQDSRKVNVLVAR